MGKNVYWLLIADTIKAKIYTTFSLKYDRPFTLVKELQHLEGLKKNQDLVSDAPGHYQTNHTARGSYTSERTPKEIENDRFARKIAVLLEHARKADQIHGLVIVTGPSFMGILKKSFSLPLQRLIVREVEKDYLHLAEHELQKILQDEIRLTR